MLIYPPSSKNIAQARRVLQKGGVIIYPTDTLYGLGADVFNQKAVERIFKIKGRDFKKPISVMVSEFSEIEKIAQVNLKQKKIIKAILPGPFTLLFKKRKNFPSFITIGSDKIGVRMPSSDICRKLSKNMPLTTTSANISGFKPTLSLKKITKEFGEKVDFILKGENLSGQPSIVIDLTEEPFKFFRY
jgi:L-threonylcarbamoyladenylate synthase